MNMKAKVHNFFEIEVYDAKTNKLKRTARAENIVLNKYFETLATGGDGSAEGYGGFMCNAIAFGRGTGTPVRTRTSLFNQIGVRTASLVGYTMDNPTSSVTRQIRLNANEFNGEVISEVGFCWTFREDGMFEHLLTHALLQDSEGNPITITKTDVDVVYIKGTFFVTVAPGTGMGDGGVYNVDPTSYLRAYLLGLRELGGIDLGNDKSSWGTSIASRWPAADVSQHYRSTGALTTAMFEANKPFYGKSNIRTMSRTYPTFTWDPVAKTLSGSLVSVLDTQYQNQVFTQIGSLLGVVTLPNHDIFPPCQILDKSIGIGDGIKQDFNIGCPVIMENSESIYINGVKKTKDVDYTIEYVNNCVDMNENYATCKYSAFDDNIELGDFKSRPAAGFPPYGRVTYDPILLAVDAAKGIFGSCCPEEAHVTEDEPILIDFLAPEKCNKIKFYGNSNMVPGASYPINIQYSEDGISYTDVTNIVRTFVAGSSTFRDCTSWKFDAVTARYWKIWWTNKECIFYMKDESNPSTYAPWEVNGIKYQNHFMLGYTAPGLHFVEPPAAGAIITADYSIDVLFKTANNILRWQYAASVDFGENS